MKISRAELAQSLDFIDRFLRLALRYPRTAAEDYTAFRAKIASKHLTDMSVHSKYRGCVVAIMGGQVSMDSLMVTCPYCLEMHGAYGRFTREVRSKRA